MNINFVSVRKKKKAIRITPAQRPRPPCSHPDKRSEFLFDALPRPAVLVLMVVLGVGGVDGGVDGGAREAQTFWPLSDASRPEAHASVHHLGPFPPDC